MKHIPAKIDDKIEGVIQYLMVLLPLAIIASKAGGDIVLSIIAALFLLKTAITRDIKWLSNTWVKLAFLFWFYLLLRAGFTPDPIDGLGRALPWIRYPLFTAALAYGISWQGNWPRHMMYSLAAGMGFLVFDALFQFAYGADIFGHEKISTGYESNAFRLTGPYRTARLGYVIVWMALPLIAFLLQRTSQSLWLRMGKYAFFFLIVIVIFISGNRTPLLLLFLGLGLLTLASPLIRLKMLWCFLAIVPVAIIVMIWDPSIHRRQIVSIVNSIQHLPDTVYGKIWLDSADMVKTAPIFGIGIKEFRNYCAVHEEMHCRFPSMHPHNIYLEILTETGLVGLALFLAMLISLGGAIYQSRKVWQKDIILVGVLIAVILRLWPIIASPGFFVAWSIVPLWWMLGWVLSTTAPSEKKNA